MCIPFRTTFPEYSRAWYLFHNPKGYGNKTLCRKIANIFFHVITLGIPFLFYHAISYCLTKCQVLMKTFFDDSADSNCNQNSSIASLE